MTDKKNAITTPKDIPTDVVRDFPGRFYVEPLELRRLAADIDQLLWIEKEGQKKTIRFWVRLENGVLYDTDDLEVVLREENENSKSNKTRIMLMVVIGELVEENDEFVRRIVVQFSRAKESLSRTFAWEHIHNETFNLNYHGLNYRVRDKNRQSATTIIDKLESRMVKFRRWYSVLPPNHRLELKSISTGLQLLLFGIVGILSAILLEKVSLPLPIPLYSAVYNTMTAMSLSLISFSLLYIVLFIALFAIMWFIPPTAFEIGDEVKEIQQGKKTREFILVTIVLGLILGVASGILHDFLVNVFHRSKGW